MKDCSTWQSWKIYNNTSCSSVEPYTKEESNLKATIAKLLVYDFITVVSCSVWDIDKHTSYVYTIIFDTLFWF